MANANTIDESKLQAYLTLACLYQATEPSQSLDPWDQKDSWQMNLTRKQNFTFLVNNNTLTTQLEYHLDTFIKAHHSENTNIITHYQREPDYIRANINDEYYEAQIFKQSHQINLLTRQGIFTFVYYTPEAALKKEDNGQQQLTAPMPGTVVALQVKVGDRVKFGQHLIVLEAMKMEHTLSAPYAGTIKEIYFPLGAQVADGQELMVIEASQ